MLFACLSLSGCASLQLMSWGASGLSYVVTGKSISDHAISTVMKKDCALHRSIFGEQTCVDHDGDGIIRGEKPGEHPRIAREDNWQVVATSDHQPTKVADVISRRQLPPINHPQLVQRKSKPNEQSKLKFIRTSVSPDQTVRTLMAKQKHQHDEDSQKIDSQMAASTVYTDKPALYAVVGSYNNKHFAQRNIIKQAVHSKMKAKLMVNSTESMNKGAPKYRVLIGPLTVNQFSTSLGDVGESPNHAAWRMTLCQQTLLPPPCNRNMFVANRQ